MSNERINSSRVDFPLNLRGANTDAAQDMPNEESVRPALRKDPLTGDVIANSRDRGEQPYFIAEESLDKFIDGLARRAYFNGDDLEAVADLVHYSRHLEPKVLTRAMGKLAREVHTLESDTRS